MVCGIQKRVIFALEMRSEEIDFLLSDSGREVVRQNRGRDPHRVALDEKVPYRAAVATQIKYLERARRKLPSYVEAEAVLLPRAFEQASSEEAASAKGISGDSLLDLTCGLGVDTLHLSRHFRRVVSLERDPLLARVTRENLRRMGVEHVEVLCASAEEYLATCTEHFDWIYADPDRRNDEGRKQVCLEDCSPDILRLQPLLERVGDRLCLKNSPLFDVEEAFRLFPKSRVRVLSIGDECKEILILTGEENPRLEVEALHRGVLSVERSAVEHHSMGPFEPERYRWLVIPDVALQKARLVNHHLGGRCYVASENGYAFSAEYPEGVVGRVEEIERIEPYNPRQLKRELKGVGVELLKRDFPLSVEEVRRRCALKQGAERRIALTKIEGHSWTIWLK